MGFRSPLTVFKGEDGNVAIIAALCILPLTIMVGVSVDLSNATRVRLALQDSTDSAALAIARNASSIADNQVATAARNYIDASYENRASYTINTASIDRTTLTVRVAATASVSTIFAGIIGKSVIPVSATSVVKGQGADYEIALALDNSGSMASKAGSGDTKIAELKEATTALFDAMMTTANAGHVKIGIVPFATSVKVGSQYKTATWMDTGGNSSVDGENFDSSASRFDLFDSSKGGLQNASWAGCVETREITVGGVVKDYDVNDTVPSSSNPQTLFVPWFAPDEPDGDNYKDSGGSQYDYRTGYFSNNYLDDEGGNCSGSSAVVKAYDSVKQARVCKYKGESISSTALYYGLGPNYLCTTTAITPLTATRSTLNSAVTAMAANGNTNILEGTMWAWRVLSPTAPFTEGAAYTTPNLYKIMIIMSDGLNNYPGANNFNNSKYFSYGYSAKGRIGSTSDDTDTLIGKLDERTKKACANAKAAGVIIYTVALGNDADPALLSYCASKSSYAYAPKNGSELKPVFLAIAASINKLRIAQ